MPTNKQINMQIRREERRQREEAVAHARDRFIAERGSPSALDQIDFIVYSKTDTMWVPAEEISRYIPQIRSIQRGERFGLKSYTTVIEPELTERNVNYAVESARSGISFTAFCLSLEAYQMYTKTVAVNIENNDTFIDVFTGKPVDPSSPRIAIEGTVQPTGRLASNTEKLLALFLVFSPTELSYEGLKEELEKTGFNSKYVQNSEFRQAIFTSMMRLWGADYALPLFEQLGLSEEDQSKYYRKIGSYSTMFALATTANLRTGTVYPYPAGVSENLPDVLALPSIVEAYIQFLQGILDNGLFIGAPDELATQIVYLFDGLAIGKGGRGSDRPSLLKRICGEDEGMLLTLLPVWGQMAEEVKKLARKIIRTPKHIDPSTKPERGRDYAAYDLGSSAESQFAEQFTELGLRLSRKMPKSAKKKLFLGSDE